MFPEVTALLDLGSSGCAPNQNILITESNTDASWLIHHFISTYLKQNFNVCFVALAQSFSHYNAIGNKLGVSLTKAKQTGNLRFLDGFSALDQSSSEALVNFADGSQAHGTLQKLYTWVATSVKQLEGTPSRETLIVVDDLTLLLSLGVPVLDTIYFAHYLRNLAHRDKEQKTCFLTLAHCSDATEEDEDIDTVVKQLKHNCDLLLQVEGLSSGYSKDVHGQVFVKWRNIGQLSSKPTSKRAQFKILDKNVSLFAHGMSAAVL